MLEIFKNPYVIIPLISFFIAQSMKFTIRLIRNEGGSGIKRFIGSGNMPSSHTAIVVALALTAGFEDGVESPFFGISLVFTAIVIYDALNVRRAVGEQGGVIMKLIERTRTAKEEREKLRLREVLGHRPIEVLAGAVLGVVITMILEYEKWWDQFYNGLTNISDFERQVYYGLSAGIIVAGFIITALFRRRNLRKLPTSKAIIRAVTRTLVVPGFFGLFFTWLLQEDVARFDSALWLFLTAVWVGSALVWYWFKVFSGSFQRIPAEREHFSEEKKRARQRRHKKKRKR